LHRSAQETSINPFLSKIITDHDLRNSALTWPNTHITQL